MEEYSQQFREITDEEIEKFVQGYRIDPSSDFTKPFDEVLRLGAIVGAKAMRDGKIKPDHVTMSDLKIADREIPINEYLLDE